MKRLLFVILLTIMGCCGVHVQAVGYEKIINPVLKKSSSKEIFLVKCLQIQKFRLPLHTQTKTMRK